MPPVISNARITFYNKDGYNVACTVSDNAGVTRVAFPTWTDKNGQDDIKWLNGSISGNTATFRVNVSDHNYEAGRYITHIYAYDAAGNQSNSLGISHDIDRTAPVISNVKVTNVTTDGYTVTCDVSDNNKVVRVQFPTWTASNEQDDLAPNWETNPIVSGTLSGNKATFKVKISDHRNERGLYATHIYAYDAHGNVTGAKAPNTTVPAYVPVTGIVLDPTSATIAVDDYVLLNVGVTPYNATNSVIWIQNSNPKVAEVYVIENTYPVVIGASPGTAIITMKADDGGKTATCKVTVVAAAKAVNPTGIKLDKTTATVNAGSSITLKPTITPSNATDKFVTWKSSDTKIATVSAAGVVTGAKAGQATISATTQNGKTAKCTVTVKAPTSTAPKPTTKPVVLKPTAQPTPKPTAKPTPKPTAKPTPKPARKPIAVKSVKMNKIAIVLQPGQGMQLVGKAQPSNAAKRAVKWKSKDESIAKVSAKGKVTGVKKGKTTVTATTTNGKKATCIVYVGGRKTVSVKLNKTRLTLNSGQSATLKAKILPKKATHKGLVWKTDNPRVASVKNGVVRGVGAGTAVITVMTEQGERKARCKVTVV